MGCGKRLGVGTVHRCHQWAVRTVSGLRPLCTTRLTGEDEIRLESEHWGWGDSRVNVLTPCRVSCRSGWVGWSSSTDREVERSPLSLRVSRLGRDGCEDTEDPGRTFHSFKASSSVCRPGHVVTRTEQERPFYLNQDCRHDVLPHLPRSSHPSRIRASCRKRGGLPSVTLPESSRP